MEKLFLRITASKLSSIRVLFRSSKLELHITDVMETLEHQELYQHDM